MVSELVKNIMASLKEQYPYIETPAAMRARITSAVPSSQKYSFACTITDLTSGEQHDCIIEQDIFKYSVKIIDNTGADLPSYPSIPGILSRQAFKPGETVTVVFTGMDKLPTIAG